MVTTDKHGRLGLMVEMPKSSDWQIADIEERNLCENAREPNFASSMAVLCSSYGHELLPEGVHYAPWRPWRVQGLSLIAVDSKHRMVGRMDVPESAGAAAFFDARLLLETALELAKAPSLDPAYSDGYGQEDDDSDENFGEEWKRRG